MDKENEQKNTIPNGESSAVSVPYFVYEGTVERMAQNNRRLLIALIVSLVILFLNNVTWITFVHMEHSAQGVETTIEESGK